MLFRIAIAGAFCIPVVAPQALELGKAQGFGEKHRMQPAEVARLETHLIRNPGDLSARARLLMHYFQFAVGQPRLAHILWVVKNRPESKLAGSPPARIAPDVDRWTTGSDYEAARALWLGNIQRFANDPAVLRNAGHFFEAEEPARAADLLRRAWALEPENKFRRAELVAFYKRVLAKCELPVRTCPAPTWLFDVRLQLQALSPHR